MQSLGGQVIRDLLASIAHGGALIRRSRVRAPELSRPRGLFLKEEHRLLVAQLTERSLTKQWPRVRIPLGTLVKAC
jgi:hypothetical protein